METRKLWTFATRGLSTPFWWSPEYCISRRNVPVKCTVNKSCRYKFHLLFWIATLPIWWRWSITKLFSYNRWQLYIRRYIDIQYFMKLSKAHPSRWEMLADTITISRYCLEQKVNISFWLSTTKNADSNIDKIYANYPNLGYSCHNDIMNHNNQNFKLSEMGTLFDLA